jgi:hypothetical protein
MFIRCLLFTCLFNLALIIGCLTVFLAFLVSYTKSNMITVCIYIYSVLFHILIIVFDAVDDFTNFRCVRCTYSRCLLAWLVFITCKNWRNYQ